MIATLRERNFALLWTASLVSVLGDQLLGIALPFYVYQQTQSVLAMGVMVIVGHVPRIALGSIAGVFVDRWHQQWTMVWVDGLRSVLLLLLIVMDPTGWFWLLYFVLTVQAALTQLFDPAKSALLPRLVQPEKLMAANALDALASRFARLVGPPVGGALLGALGLTLVILVDSASFLLSGILLALIRLPFVPARKRVEDKDLSVRTHGMRIGGLTLPSASFWREWLAGLHLLQKESLVKTVFIVEGIGMISEGIINVLWVVFVQAVMQSSALELGWLSSAFACGAILGGLIIAQVKHALSPTYSIALADILVGVLWLVMLYNADLQLSLILLFLNGIVAMGYGVSVQTLLQANIAGTYRGRLFGTYSTTNSFMRLVGVGLAIGLGEALGTAFMLNVASALFILTGVFALIRFNQQARQAHEVA
jgi:MFS family permease